MSEASTDSTEDALTAPFWAAARRHVLVAQRCAACGWQSFMPRPFCVKCDGESLAWIELSGRGVVHATTTIRRQVWPEYPPPYNNAIVQLDDGPRMLTSVINGDVAIGGRVRVLWRERDGKPPIPLFEPDGPLA